MRDCYTPTSVPSPVPPLEPVMSRFAFSISLFAMTLACLLGCGMHVRAQDSAGDQPAHVLAMGSVGVPLRLTVSDKFRQSRLAPGFANVLLGLALPGERFRHGFGLGVSWNLGHDGGYTDPIYAVDQIVLMPAYLAYYQVNADVIALGHVGVPILVRGGPNAGAEIGAALDYRVLAGAGLFAQVDIDAFGGGTFNLLASLELGVLIDCEVLP